MYLPSGIDIGNARVLICAGVNKYRFALLQGRERRFADTTGFERLFLFAIDQQRDARIVLLIDEQDNSCITLLVDSEKKEPLKSGRVSEPALSALQQGEPVFIHTRTNKNSRITNINARRQIHSSWAFPIKVKKRTIGILVLRFIKTYECLPKEREVMEALLGRAALGIERALLQERIRANDLR